MFLKKDNFHEHFNRIFLLRFDFWVAKNVVWLEIVPKFQVFYKPIINFFFLGRGLIYQYSFRVNFWKNLCRIHFDLLFNPLIYVGKGF